MAFAERKMRSNASVLGEKEIDGKQKDKKKEAFNRKAKQEEASGNKEDYLNVETENTFTDYKSWWNEVVDGHSPKKTEETYSRKEHDNEEPIIKNAKINTPLTTGNSGLAESTKLHASCTKCSAEQVHI